MIRTVNNIGVKATVRNTKFKFFIVAILATFLIILTGCPKGTDSSGPNPDGDPNETAATVNGTAIKLEEVERAIKEQSKGQEANLSQLELTQARLQVLEGLIQQEVMYQKAQKEEVIPKDEDITAELNKMKQGSGMSKDDFEKKMKEVGATEEIIREQIKKQIAISKLVEKVTGKVDAPTDSEIEAFYNGNKEAFVKKRGVKLATIVIDPTDTGNGDTTIDESSAKLKVEEIFKKINGGGDFAAIATEMSEDPSRLRKGDLGYISEEQMKTAFSPQLAEAFMSEKFQIGGVTPAIPLQGKFYIFKLQDKVEKDEDLTLESEGVKAQITDSLINARKQLLQASYAAIAMDEADIVNYLAKKVVDNPNDLSGARPASANDGADKKDEKSESNTNTNANVEKKDDADVNKDDKSATEKTDEKSADKPTDADKEKEAKADDKKAEEKK